MGAAKTAGIILGVSAAVLVIVYLFLVPYFHRRLIMNDAWMRSWHIPLGLLLCRDNHPMYFPGKGDQVVTDYYAKTSVEDLNYDLEKFPTKGDTKDGSTATGTNGTNGHNNGISTAMQSNSSHRNDTTERAPRGLSVPNPQGDQIVHPILKKSGYLRFDLRLLVDDVLGLFCPNLTNTTRS
jgi:hypothetical protein